ncbi:MAG: protein kinase [Xanthobacteraceae bacterium]|nr:protein kinase [Xanthobacteraceae bacterium]QYK45442.1 MAG: protein kinase [Xanthobacteraceae bacterium]
MTHDPHALPAGTVIAGYRIVRVLGAGGFGITYEGESPVTGRRVAIKEFFPRGIASRKGATEIIYAERDSELVSWALKRFESSTTEQCRLKHPNIVEVFHYLADNDTGYMFMDYVDGITLESWLKKLGTLPTVAQLRPMMQPVFDALEYLHGMSFIHRDIAPDNIMITAEGRPVIIDFGAIKLIENRTLLQAKTVHSFMVGKQHYSPPEQTREGETLDARADIYALGAVLYRAFSGKPPSDTEERARKIAFGEGDSIVPLSEVAPQIPADVAAAIEKALSFRAAERQDSIYELREALGWVDPLPATTPVPRDISRDFERPAPAVSPSYGKAEPVKKSMGMRWAAAAAAAVVLVLGGAFALGMNPLRTTQSETPVAPIARVDEPKQRIETPAVPPVAQPQKQETPVSPPVAEPKPEAPSAPPVVEQKPETPVAPPPQPQQQVMIKPETPPVDHEAEMRRDFELAQKVDTKESYELYLRRHPDGYYSTLARQQLVKIAALETKELTRNLITELQRSGCGPDNNDGEWSDATRKSLTNYNRHAKTKYDVNAPSRETLDGLKDRSGRVCPLVCQTGFQVKGNECVAIPQKRREQPQAQRQQRPQQQQQQQQQSPQLPRGILCVRGVCVGN